MRPPDAWLVAQGRVLASATVAESRSERRRGLIGQNDPQFALVLPRCKWIHTFGMRCAIDVAYLDDKSQVMKVQHLAPMRLPLPAGSFERWGLRVGDVVEVRRG